MSSLLLLFGLAAAHNPDISTYVVTETSDGWELRVHLATAGLHTALSQRVGPGLAAFDLQAYEAETEAAVREGLTLKVDGKPVPVGDCEVAIAAHQSDLVCALPTGGLALEGSVVRSFAEQPNQHNVLRVVSEQGARQWVLAERNGFAVGVAQL